MEKLSIDLIWSSAAKIWIEKTWVTCEQRKLANVAYHDPALKACGSNYDGPWKDFLPGPKRKTPQEYIHGISWNLMFWVFIRTTQAWTYLLQDTYDKGHSPRSIYHLAKMYSGMFLNQVMPSTSLYLGMGIPTWTYTFHWPYGWGEHFQGQTLLVRFVSRASMISISSCRSAGACLSFRSKNQKD